MEGMEGGRAGGMDAWTVGRGDGVKGKNEVSRRREVET